jgi:hypothetical protein
VRFPVSFQRQKGVGGSTLPAIGSDAVPTKAPVANTPTNPNSNVMACKIRDVNGWPVQRIAVGWTTSAATPTQFNVDMYLWETTSQAWYLMGSLAMNPNQLYFFDTIAVSEPTPLQSNVNQPGSPAQAGSMNVALVVTDPGAQVNGTFTFVMAPDLTTIGT